MKRVPSTLVYFIKPSGLDGPIKIGSSERPMTRLMDLAAWSPWPLELIGTAQGTIADEHFLHKCFADCHSHREWFHSTPNLREAIQNIIAQGIQFAHAQLVPKGNIRSSRKPFSLESRQKISVEMKGYWTRRKEQQRPDLAKIFDNTEAAE